MDFQPEYIFNLCVICRCDRFVSTLHKGRNDNWTQIQLVSQEFGTNGTECDVWKVDQNYMTKKIRWRGASSTLRNKIGYEIV